MRNHVGGDADVGLRAGDRGGGLVAGDEIRGREVVLHERGAVVDLGVARAREGGGALRDLEGHVGFVLPGADADDLDVVVARVHERVGREDGDVVGVEHERRAVGRRLHDERDVGVLRRAVVDRVLGDGDDRADHARARGDLVEDRAGGPFDGDEVVALRDAVGVRVGELRRRRAGDDVRDRVEADLRVGRDGPAVLRDDRAAGDGDGRRAVRVAAVVDDDRVARGEHAVARGLVGGLRAVGGERAARDVHDAALDVEGRRSGDGAAGDRERAAVGLEDARAVRRGNDRSLVDRDRGGRIALAAVAGDRRVGLAGGGAGDLAVHDELDAARVLAERGDRVAAVGGDGDVLADRELGGGRARIADADDGGGLAEAGAGRGDRALARELDRAGLHPQGARVRRGDVLAVQVDHEILRDPDRGRQRRVVEEADRVTGLGGGDGGGEIGVVLDRAVRDGNHGRLRRGDLVEA